MSAATVNISTASAGNYQDTMDTYAAAWEKYRSVSKALSQLQMDEVEKERLSDSLRYQIEELERAGLKAGEYDSICARRDLLRNSEKLTDALDQAMDALSSGEDNALSMAQNAAYYTGKASAYASELEAAAENINSAVFTPTDAAETLRDFRDSLDFSPEEYITIETRIALLNKLQRKYSRDEDALISYLDECREKLDGIQYAEEPPAKLRRELDAAAKDCAAGRRPQREAPRGRIRA